MANENNVFEQQNNLDKELRQMEELVIKEFKSKQSFTQHDKERMTGKKKKKNLAQNL